VRQELRDPDSTVDLIRAILQAAGMDPRVERDVIMVRDHAVVVVQSPGGGTVGREAMNKAYLLVQHAGTRRGLVLSVGHFDMREVRRRQALAPHVAYVGSTGIQRMADAVELGTDPLQFAIPPSFGGPT
jgi:hypothetical protein